MQILAGRRRRHRRSPITLGRVAAAASLGLLLVLLATVGVAAAGGYAGWNYVTQDLPSVQQVEAVQFATTKIYDRNWKLLSEVSDPNTGLRTPVGYQEIQDHITQQQSDLTAPHRAWIFDATVSAEDASFWTNQGVDPLAIGRSFLSNLSGSAGSGASTITQQLVRALYPDSIGFDRSYTRKLREAIVAYQFSRHYTKPQVLEMYLNDVYYGNRAYGVDAASMTYFNKHPWGLTLGEAAMLAGLPQAPSAYDPTQNYELAKARQRYVLDQMTRQGVISQQAADDAYAEPIRVVPPQLPADVAPHFVNYVQYYLEQKFGAAALYRGGLVVHTTLDSNLQADAQKIVSDHVRDYTAYDVDNGALVAMLPWDGEIVSMVGSADYYNDAIDGQVNVTTRERQPGSSIKPITYLAAFEKGWNPGTVIFDYDKKWPTPGAPDPFYEPHDYTFQNYGAVSVRTALSNSLNIPAVQALDYVGVPTMIDLAHRMGIVSGLWRGTSFYGLAVTLGGGEVTPLEHTNAFATLANNGRYVSYTPLLDVTDSQGNVLYKLDRQHAFDQGQQVVEAAHAYQITSILTDNSARAMVFGTQTPLTLPELNRPAGAKTGTTNDARDLWTMGYTTDLVVGVWTGNTDNHAPRQNLDGVTTAAPVWHDFMVKAHSDPQFAQTLAGPDGKPIAPDFPRPSNVYNGPVCAATGGMPTPGARTVTEVLVRGEGPTLPCNKVDPYSTQELKAALADVGHNAHFTSTGTQSLYTYAAMVNVTAPSVRPQSTRTPTRPVAPTPTAIPGRRPTPTATGP
ncbi:MAG TPA: transglycosylase domain-containing protein [Thermomicrobiaceae bacterium]|nr:transglycosylase domain-containing protein [Thermomicrobiaceae bacterium]